MRQVATSAPEPIQSINPAIPMWLCDLIRKLHARDRQERFQSASEVEVVFAQRRGRQAVLQSAQAQPQASTLPTTSVRSTAAVAPGFRLLCCWQRYAWAFCARLSMAGWLADEAITQNGTSGSHRESAAGCHRTGRHHTGWMGRLADRCSTSC